MSIFKIADNYDHINEPMFFGNPPPVARYDRIRYPWVDKLTDQMNGFHWLPAGRDLSRDGPQFRAMSEAEQHVFVSNLKRQIILDSIQGRAITEAFMPVVSAPELEPLLVTWEYFETIHSKTYTHIIRNVMPDASSIFDDILVNEEITKTAGNLTKYYDDYIDYLNVWKVIVGHFDVDNDTEFEFRDRVYTLRELKTKFFMCLVSVNVLEGLRFYVSFLCSWSFAERSKMEGNAGLIKLISRDENIHTKITQKLIKELRNDPFYEQIFQDNIDEIYKMYDDTVREEKEWAEYLFSKGNLLGLNAELLGQYLEFMANKRLRSIGLKNRYNNVINPIKWVESWTGSKDVQVANQETENTGYLMDSVKNDLGDNNALFEMEL